jgi:DNA-binding NarL/FixJ family response regulator
METIPSHPSLKPTRVVVVEDDSATRKMLVAALEADADYKVVAEFGEGVAALASLKQIEHDLVLLDLGLPDISGIEIIRAIGATHPQCDVVVITTFGDDHSVFSALEAGARGYLLKGATAEELRRDVRLLRDGGSPLSPSIARKLLDRLSVKKADQILPQHKESSLTLREIEILQLIGQGFSYNETAVHCHIKNVTVHAHLKSIYRKLAVHSNIEAVYEARRKNIIR